MTFMTMAYILAVNPQVLSAAGIPRGGVFVATALAAVLGTSTTTTYVESASGVMAGGQDCARGERFQLHVHIRPRRA